MAKLIKENVTRIRETLATFEVGESLDVSIWDCKESVMRTCCTQQRACGKEFKVQTKSNDSYTITRLS